jgi:hypothetical protein
MEVNLLDRHRVDPGFGFAEKLEGARSVGLYGVGEWSRLDDSEDCRERAVRLMRVLVRVLMRMHGSICVRVFVFMLMIVTVRVHVRMLVLVILHWMIVNVLVALSRQDVDFGSAETAAHDLPVLEARANVESRNRVLKNREGNASIDEGAEKHVAADAGEAFEISNSHREDCN